MTLDSLAPSSLFVLASLLLGGGTSTVRGRYQPVDVGLDLIFDFGIQEVVRVLQDGRQVLHARPQGFAVAVLVAPDAEVVHDGNPQHGRAGRYGLAGQQRGGNFVKRRRLRAAPARGVVDQAQIENDDCGRHLRGGVAAAAAAW